MVPLYFAMLVAYGSVKRYKIFTPEQCSGINRFVAVFAVPVLSFHFIAQNNPYQMDTRFMMADTLSKVLVLVLLSIWVIFFNGGLDWLITLFSIATLPNTLVMGIPLLKAMYGDFTQSLMVQVVVLQCIIWYCEHILVPIFLSLFLLKKILAPHKSLWDGWFFFVGNSSPPSQIVMWFPLIYISFRRKTVAEKFVNTKDKASVPPHKKFILLLTSKSIQSNELHFTCLKNFEKESWKLLTTQI